MTKIKLIAILLLVSVFTYGQDKKTYQLHITYRSIKPEPFIEILASNPHIDSFYILMVSDGYKKLCYMKGDSSIVVTDSMGAIKQLMYFYLYDLKSINKLQAKYDAADEILSYVTIDGRIPDKKRFNKAVKKYLKLLKK